MTTDRSAGRAVTLSDVAAVAGVSLSTASKALNGSTRISAATRERIADAARRLDFRPNALAQSFASGRSQTIGVLTHRASSTFARPVIISAVLRLGARERAALVYDGDRLDRGSVRESIRQLGARRVDAVLVIGDGPEQRSRSLTHELSAPVVYAYTLTDADDDLCFLPDNTAVGVLATEHLVAGGRRSIAHVTAKGSSIAVRSRVDGMRSVLDGHGLPLRGGVRYGEWSQHSGAVTTAALLDDEPDVDAIFCGNDLIALGAMTTLRRRGIRVPDDIALVGVDNWEGVVVDQGTRALTSVDLCLERIGADAADALLDGDRTGGVRLQPPTLVPGDSSATG